MSFVLPFALPLSGVIATVVVPTASAVTEPAPVQVNRVEVPVNWQVTRARFAGTEANTQTESYRESWFLEISSTGEAFIASRRAKVSVYRSGAMRSVDGVPSAVVMSEADFARLIGLLPPAATDALSGMPLHSAGTFRQGAKSLVTIALTSDNDGVDLTLRLSDDEHFNVHHEAALAKSTSSEATVDEPQVK